MKFKKYLSQYYPELQGNISEKVNKFDRVKLREILTKVKTTRQKDLK